MSELLVTNGSDPFEIFKHTTGSGEVAYSAGFPSYLANFTRDAIIAGIQAGRSDLLTSQLAISAIHQGSTNDASTGQRPGKIHHEVPGAQLEGRRGYTTYNACDTTALFLIGAEGLLYLDSKRYADIYAKHANNLRRAAKHIISQVDKTDDLFWEGPPDGDDGYTLRVTYWKDSILPHSDGKLEPMYPVVYAQAHFIAARGLLSAARLLHRPDMEKKADRMYRAGIESFMETDHYTVYRDKEGELHQASSDELHSLAYIPVTYKELLPLSALRQRAQEIATPYGYMCTPRYVAEHLSDNYHGDKIWVFEQAHIHYAATKFGLDEQASTARAISEHIGEGQELFGLNQDGLKPEGNNRQLWSVAASAYFAGKSNLSENNWL